MIVVTVEAQSRKLRPPVKFLLVLLGAIVSGVLVCGLLFFAFVQVMARAHRPKQVVCRCADGEVVNSSMYISDPEVDRHCRVIACANRGGGSVNP